MWKKALCLLAMLLMVLPAAAAPAADDSSAAMLQTVWKAQTIDGLDNGIWVIPEDAINQYFAGCADNDKIKNPTLKLLGDNKLLVAFDSSIGRVGLTCEVKQFVHNQTESYAEVYVRKKEVADKPFVSWMLKFVPLGALADLYGNPLKDVNQVDAKFSGNTLKINFRPLVEKSLLGNDFGRKVEISSMTTREGALELHTNMRAADLLGVLMTQKNG
ncbi:MAG: hypothetical protein P4N41_15430 [Negativicutes bacterium]|nr:hypothetical protein [Negativicutes bacterium]